MAVSDKKFNEMMTHNKMLENQISQLANALIDQAIPSSLPSQGIGPKKPVNAIVTRSGKVLEERLPRRSEDKEVPKEALVENERDRASLDEVVVETPRECDHHEQNATQVKDPGNFSIPCAINKMQIDSALCYLGDNVSLMPYSVYKILDLRELLPSNITLQLANRLIKFPKGKVEDVPLRVGKFVFPVDLVVLEMDEDATIPIILGRPFLATSGAMIDVKCAKISLKVGDELIEFDLN
ncbi:uncharacterized protein LOC110686867 [Chenopodium quinoa]|uniref:uncharacterized protein LOC110686867 n=1 Tax=Chenopodium quinoa TaxID=63459 RepID=UPI000B782234|nr:uncharacterized protein LOC110686867 [Chenopodium quinoa]